MRKLLLVLIGGLTAAALGAAVVAWNVIRQLSPGEINKRITAGVKAETGLDLVSAHLTTAISYHVIITLNSVRLMDGNQTLARFDHIRLTCGYRTLLFHGGLPFLAVSLDRPTVVLPVRSVTPGPMPVLDTDSVRDLRKILVRLSNVTRRIVLSTAKIEDRAGQVLFDNAAVRATHNRMAGAWRVRLEGLFRGVALPNLKVGADLVMAPEIDGAEVPFARGSLWFWDAQLQDFQTRGIKLRGDVQGNVTFLVRTDGSVRGQAQTHTHGFQFSGPPFAAPITVADLALSARLLHSSDGLELNQLTMAANGRQVFSGSASVQPLPPDNLRIRAYLAPLTLDATQVKSLLQRITGLPERISHYGQMVSAGRVTIDELSLNTTLKELVAPSTRTLLERTRFKATLDGLALNAPDVPPVAELDGKLDYAGGLVRLTQSHASLGGSRLDQISVIGDLGRGAAEVPYKIKVAGEFDLGEIFNTLRHWLTGATAAPLRRVETLRGRTAAEVDLQGDLTQLALVKPPEFKAVLRPQGVMMGVAAAPSEFKLWGGTITVSPNEIVLDNIDLAPRHGSMRASGRLERTAPGEWEIGNLSLDMHQINAQEWLPRLIAIDMMDVHAPATGKLAISAIKDGGARSYRVDGNLAVGPGEIKFAFLRSPVILTDPAWVTLDGQGGNIAIASGRLEGSSMQMTIGVADVRKPLVKIDAHAQRLDLEAISAVRLPWSPEVPVKLDNTPFEGHIEADEANFSRLDMKSLKASFKRDADNWRVFDINADAMGGHVTMELTGHRRDDWVHIVSSTRNMDAVALQGLGSNRTVVTGRFSSQANLWADTDKDFFSTLTGSLSSTIENGVLLRFKLLSRMLSLVDVSEWLNAKFPDPLVKGVPFSTITARFTGERGSFETSDFILDGPVMKITAAGTVDVEQSAMDMLIGMRPFQLLDTVFNKIPLIGNRLAQSQSGIVAAYFHVQGPIDDPVVVPAPIASIGHLLIKTLAIPINLIVPETVK